MARLILLLIKDRKNTIMSETDNSESIVVRGRSKVTCSAIF